MKWAKIIGYNMILQVINPINNSNAPFLVKVSSWVLIGIGIGLILGSEETND